jgi:hypothetical protein
MKLLTVILLFLLVPVLAHAETLEGEVSRSSSKEGASQQSGTVDEELLKGQNSESDTQQSPIDLHATSLSGQVEGGELPIGVLGCETLFTLFNSHSGIILKIFPGSDLLRLGIRPGDRIIGIDGHRIARKNFSRECRGTPGTTINLLIERGGQEIEVQAVRKDARIFGAYSHYFRKWAGQTKYW